MYLHLEWLLNITILPCCDLVLVFLFKGKLELEIQVLTKEEEKLLTARKSRDDSSINLAPESK